MFVFAFLWYYFVVSLFGVGCYWLLLRWLGVLLYCLRWWLFWFDWFVLVWCVVVVCLFVLGFGCYVMVWVDVSVFMVMHYYRLLWFWLVLFIS